MNSKKRIYKFEQIAIGTMVFVVVVSTILVLFARIPESSSYFTSSVISVTYYIGN